MKGRRYCIITMYLLLLLKRGVIYLLGYHSIKQNYWADLTGILLYPRKNTTYYRLDCSRF